MTTNSSSSACTYSKYCANVFLAKTIQFFKKGDLIELQTKYGKINECIVFNLVYQKDGYNFYSIVRADGFNVQEYAKKKAERYNNWAASAEKKSDEFFKHSHDLTKHIPFGQPILVGHHSESGHRKLLDKSWNAMGKSVEFSDLAENHESKAEYWEKRAKIINLSMPESLELYEYKLQEAISNHEGLKNGTIDRKHSFDLPYSNKCIKDLKSKVEIAKKLWE